MDEIYEEMQQIADHFDAMLEEHKGQLGFKITRDDAILLRDWMRKAIERAPAIEASVDDNGLMIAYQKGVEDAKRDQAEKTRVMELMAGVLAAVESRTTPEMALRVNATLSQYEAMEEK